MGELFESGNAFAVPELFQKSSLANRQVSEPALEVDRLSPFSMSIYSQEVPGLTRSVFHADREPNNSLLALSHTVFGLLTLNVSSDDPLQTSKSLGCEQESVPSFSYGPLEDLEPLDQISASSDGEEQEAFEDPLEDLWSSREIFEPVVQQLEVKSWERFHDKAFKEPCIPYISEAGPRIFDAALDHGLTPDVDEASLHRPTPALRSDAVLSSLLQLALGRESLLFQYDEKEDTFRRASEPLRVSGYTVECFHGAMAIFMKYGNQLRQAKGFVRTVHSSKNTAAASVALASGIETVITALETQLSGPLTSTQTVLQLQALLEPSRMLLDQLSDIIEKARKSESSEHLLSMLFNYMQDSEYSSPWLQTIMEQLLAHASTP